MDIMNRIKSSKLDTKNNLCIKTIDMHTAGEPLRVIISGYPEIKGSSILEKRTYVKDNLDYLRKALMFEPRGHADMYGALLCEASNSEADFAAIFMHNEGYSTMCGHATIALGKLAVELGWVELVKPITKIKIEAPCGLLDVFVHIKEDNEVEQVSFHCVPSFVLAMNENISINNIGDIRYDLAYGGAFYAYVDADKIGLNLNKENYDKIIFYGKEIKKNIIKQKNNIIHPFEKDLSFLYGVIFISQNSKHHSQNVCVFANGELDRSPTGSGVSGRVAIHYKKKEIKKDEIIRIESVLNTCFDVKVIKELKYSHLDAVIPEVYGNAYITGEHTFYLDEQDELKYGFLLK